MPSGWNDWFTLVNTVESFLFPAILFLVGERFHKAWRSWRGKGDDDGN